MTDFTTNIPEDNLEDENKYSIEMPEYTVALIDKIPKALLPVLFPNDFYEGLRKITDKYGFEQFTDFAIGKLRDELSYILSGIKYENNHFRDLVAAWLEWCMKEDKMYIRDELADDLWAFVEALYAKEGIRFDSNTLQYEPLQYKGTPVLFHLGTLENPSFMLTPRYFQYKGCDPAIFLENEEITIYTSTTKPKKSSMSIFWVVIAVLFIITGNTFLVSLGVLLILFWGLKAGKGSKEEYNCEVEFSSSNNTIIISTKDGYHRDEIDKIANALGGFSDGVTVYNTLLKEITK